MVTPGLAAGLSQGSVTVRHDLRGISDHVPLVATFALDAVAEYRERMGWAAPQARSEL